VRKGEKGKREGKRQEKRNKNGASKGTIFKQGRERESKRKI
jgi:hypothetical protein